MHKTLQIQVFLKAKQKKNCKLFGGLIAKNVGIYTVFEMSRKRGRHETLSIAVFWPLLDAETLVCAQFFARGRIPIFLPW